MSTKKIIVLIGCITFALIAGLILLFTHSLSETAADPETADVGLFKDASLEEEPEIITQEDLQEAYESRPELPAAIQETLHVNIARYLSAGEFSELDDYLRSLQENYKDNSDQNEDEMVVIDKYRADLTSYLLSVKDGTPRTDWAFNNPDALAAAIAYAPMSVKYQTFINRDSALMAAARKDIGLQQADLTNTESKERLDKINRSRTEENEFPQIAVYTMTILGYDCEFTAVYDNNTWRWHPYSLVATNDPTNSLPTVSLAYDLILANPDADIDAIIAFPEPLSEYPYDEPNSAPIQTADNLETEPGEEEDSASPNENPQT